MTAAKGSENWKIAYKLWNGYSSDENDLVNKIAAALDEAAAGKDAEMQERLKVSNDCIDVEIMKRKDCEKELAAFKSSRAQAERVVEVARRGFNNVKPQDFEPWCIEMEQAIRDYDAALKDGEV